MRNIHFDNRSAMKIVSIGEVLLDCYPGEQIIGGAPFNFFYHIYKLTGNAEFISRIGNDENGKSIIDFLNQNNISTQYLQVDEKYPTGLVNIKLDNKGNPSFDMLPHCAYDFIELTHDISKLIESGTSLLYFGTLAQRSSVSRETIHSILGKNIKYFCDLNLRSNYYTKEILEECFRKINVLKLNLDELKIVTKLFSTRTFELYSSAQELRRKYNIDVLSITLGEKGALLIDSSGHNETKYPVKRLTDTVGAGDAYSAILCLGYLNKLSIDKINYLSNKFAASICSIKGAIPNNGGIYETIKEELRNRHHSYPGKTF